jgi:type VI secretion system secreted protein Hcp
MENHVILNTKGGLEVNSWSHNIRQPKSATSSSVGGHTAERVEHSDMIFVKDLDATSPKLWEACSAGYTFDEVQIDFTVQMVTNVSSTYKSN